MMNFCLSRPLVQKWVSNYSGILGVVFCSFGSTFFVVVEAEAVAAAMAVTLAVAAAVAVVVIVVVAAVVAVVGAVGGGERLKQ